MMSKHGESGAIGLGFNQDVRYGDRPDAVTELVATPGITGVKGPLPLSLCCDSRQQDFQPAVFGACSWSDGSRHRFQRKPGVESDRYVGELHCRSIRQWVDRVLNDPG